MIKKCANIIADWLISCKVVEETDKELYSYAVYSIILSLYPFALAIGFGISMGCVRQSVTIIMPAIIVVHSHVILHQMWIDQCIDYCRSGCKSGLL